MKLEKLCSTRAYLETGKALLELGIWGNSGSSFGASRSNSFEASRLGQLVWETQGNSFGAAGLGNSERLWATRLGQLVWCNSSGAAGLGGVSGQLA